MFRKVVADVERVFGLRQLQETLERDVGIPVETLPNYAPVPREWLSSHPPRPHRSSSSSSVPGDNSLTASSAASGAHAAARFLFALPDVRRAPPLSAASCPPCHACGEGSATAAVAGVARAVVCCNRIGERHARRDGAAADDADSSDAASHALCDKCLQLRLGISLSSISSGRSLYRCAVCIGACSCANCVSSGTYVGGAAIEFAGGASATVLAQLAAAAATAAAAGDGASHGDEGAGRGARGRGRASDKDKDGGAGGGSSSAGSGSGAGAGAAGRKSSPGKPHSLQGGNTSSSKRSGSALPTAAREGIPMPLTAGTEALLARGGSAAGTGSSSTGNKAGSGAGAGDAVVVKAGKAGRLSSQDKDALAKAAASAMLADEDDDDDEDGGSGARKGAPAVIATAIPSQWRLKYSKDSLAVLWRPLGGDSSVAAHMLPLAPIGVTLPPMPPTVSSILAVSSSREDGGGAGGAGSAAGTGSVSSAGGGGGGSSSGSSSGGAGSSSSSSSAAVGSGSGDLPPLLHALGDLDEAKMTAVAASARPRCLLCSLPESRASSRRRLVGLHPLVPLKQSGRDGALVCEHCLATVLACRAALASRGCLVDASDGAELACAFCGASRPPSAATSAAHARDSGLSAAEAALAAGAGISRLGSGSSASSAGGSSAFHLTVCSARRCPRSYCSNCLPLLQTTKEAAAMAADDEWQCPPCAALRDMVLARMPAKAKLAVLSSGAAGASAAAFLAAATIGKGKGAGKGKGRGKGSPATTGGVTSAAAAGKGKGKAPARRKRGDDDDDDASDEETDASDADSDGSNSEENSRGSVRSRGAASGGAGLPGLPRGTQGRQTASTAGTPGGGTATGKGAGTAKVSPFSPLKGAGSRAGSAAAHSTASGSSAAAAAPIAPSYDAVTYFAAYAAAVRRRAQEAAAAAARGAAFAPPTEDECFVCRDGGDVFECDWRCSGRVGKGAAPQAAGGGSGGASAPAFSSPVTVSAFHAGARCPKVFHAECIGYEPPDNSKWECPRHKCRDCGGAAVAACRYCPNSLCGAHLAKMQLLKRKPGAGAGGGSGSKPNSGSGSFGNGAVPVPPDPGAPLTADTMIIQRASSGASPAQAAAAAAAAVGLRTPDLPPSLALMVCSTCRGLRDAAVARGILQVDALERCEDEAEAAE